MKKEDLLFGFGEIDDQILDSMLRRQINQEIRNRRRKKARKGVVMTSAGMILAAAAIVLIMIFSGTKESDISRLPSGTEIFTEADSLSKEVTETAAEMESPETGYTDIEAEKQAEEDTGYYASDSHVPQFDPQDTAKLQGAFFIIPDKASLPV